MPDEVAQVTMSGAGDYNLLAVAMMHPNILILKGFASKNTIIEMQWLDVYGLCFHDPATAA